MFEETKEKLQSGATRSKMDVRWDLMPAAALRQVAEVFELAHDSMVIGTGSVVCLRWCVTTMHKITSMPGWQGTRGATTSPMHAPTC